VLDTPAAGGCFRRFTGYLPIETQGLVVDGFSLARGPGGRAGGVRGGSSGDVQHALAVAHHPVPVLLHGDAALDRQGLGRRRRTRCCPGVRVSIRQRLISLVEKLN
jgi:hypothetical protein